MPVAATHYDMLNGYGQAHTGTYNYWDKAYTGSGNTSLEFAPLSGGLGDLTDGVIATQRWDLVENLEGTGPYVGWFAMDPVITFHFAGVHSFSQVTVWHDDGASEVIMANTANISIGGLCVYLNQIITLGKRLEIRIDNFFEGSPLTCVGHVVRCKEDPAQTSPRQKFYEVGVEFKLR